MKSFLVTQLALGFFSSGACGKADNVAVAAGQCPAGLKHIATLARATSGRTVESRLAADLPANFALDSTFQQTAIIRAGQTASTQDAIPPGFALFADGQGGSWNVSNPVLLNGRTFEISLSCHDDASGLLPGGCSVQVDVCAKEGTQTSTPPSSAQKQKRAYQGRALVIGNAGYQVEEMKLDDPEHDADGLNDALKDLGWDVVKKTNLDEAGMKAALSDFGKATKTSGVSLFFYSGHGAQVNGADFLLPIDFQLSATTPENIDSKAMDLRSVLDLLRTAQTRPNIVLLDACRDSPFSTSTQKGLSQPTNVPNQTIVGFAANFGSTAAESGEDAKYSAYTRAVLKYIRTPGLSIEDFFKQVRGSVQEYTDMFQTPRETTGLQVPFAFRPAVSILSKILNGDDEVLLIMNGEEADSWNNDGQTEKTIPLRIGKNVLSVKVYNQHTFTGGIEGLGGHFPEGWLYSFLLKDSGGNVLLDLADREDLPVKDGPHHGKMFTAATIEIDLDELSGAVTIAGVDQDIWTR